MADRLVDMSVDLWVRMWVVVSALCLVCAKVVKWAALGYYYLSKGYRRDGVLENEMLGVSEEYDCQEKTPYHLVVHSVGKAQR